MGLKGKLLAIVVALLFGGALSAAAQAPAKPAPKPIALEVTETEEADCSDCPMGKAHYRIVTRARFEVDMKQNPFTGRSGAAACTGYEVVIGEIKDGEDFCFRLKYVDGSVIQAEGASGREKAVFEMPTAEERPWKTVEDGSVHSRAGGLARIRVSTPGVSPGNAASEEALSCSLRTPVLTLTYAEVRNLYNLNKKWTSSTFTVEEMAQVCKGQYTVEIRAKGKQECEPLKTACEQAKRWAECALANLRNALGLVTQARIDLTAEQASYQAQRLPAPPWFTQFELELDRLQQAVVGAQPKVTASRAESQADCAPLPGPDDKEECEQAAARVEETTKKARAALKSDLDREMSVLEASAAVPVAARNKLLAQLRATLVLLYACE